MHVKAFEIELMKVPSYRLQKLLYVYASPFVIVVGLFGNMVSMLGPTPCWDQPGVHVGSHRSSDAPRLNLLLPCSLVGCRFARAWSRTAAEMARRGTCASRGVGRG